MQQIEEKLVIVTKSNKKQPKELFQLCLKLEISGKITNRMFKDISILKRILYFYSPILKLPRKALKLCKNIDVSEQDAESEIGLLKKMDNPNIEKYFDFFSGMKKYSSCLLKFQLIDLKYLCLFFIEFIEEIKYGKVYLIVTKFYKVNFI